jgi:hypothetical protein
MASAGVPEYLWAGVVYHESGGRPDAIGDNGQSFGLFQYNVGSGVSPTTALNPSAAGAVAAPQMGRAISPLGPNASPAQQLRAVEIAGWPGNDPKLIAAEEPARLQDLNTVIAQENQLPAGLAAQASGTDPYPNDNVVQQWVYNHTAIGPAEASTNTAVANAQNAVLGSIQGATTSINNTAQSIAKSALIGGIIIAVIAGGFALLSSSGGSDGSVKSPG